MRYVEPEPIINEDGLDANVMRQIEALAEIGQMNRAQRCLICQDDVARVLVNKLLSVMLPYAEIQRAVDASVNPNRTKKRKIGYRTITWHHKNHFNIQEPAKAIFRDMMERRARELDDQRRKQDGVNGVASLVTAFGFLDVVAHKGYETLIDDETRVPVQQGMDAVIKLHELTKMTAREQETAELRHQLDLIQAAVKEVVPREYWAEIIAKIEDAEGRVGSFHDDTVDAEVVEDDEDQEPYAPMIETDEDDDLEP